MTRKQKKRAAQQAKKADFGTLSTKFTDTANINGMSMLNYLPNPDVILRAQGGRLQVYRDMQDGHLSSVRRKRRMAVSSKSWSLQSGQGDYDKTKLVETQLWNLGLRNSIKEIMEAIDFGYQVTEVLWDHVDGMWLPVGLKGIPQEKFKFSKSGDLVFADERNGKNGNIPHYKFLLTQNNPSSSNPYGEAASSDCFWPVAFKKGNLKFWLIFAEKFGMPHLIGKTPGSATDKERADMLRDLYGLVRDAVMVVTENASVSAIETKIGGTLPYEAIVAWADREMSKAYLGETLTTEQTDTGGTRALGTVHNEVRLEMVQDDVAMVEGTFNTLLKWIWELNWPDDEEIPWFQFAQPKDMQTGELDRDKKLHDLGVRFTDKHFIDLYGVSPDHIAEIVNQQAGSMFAEGDEKPGKRSAQEPSGRKQTRAFAETLANNAGSVGLTKPIHDLVANATSLEEIRDGLIGLYAELPIDDIAKEMEQAFLAANLAGRMEMLEKAGLA